jgi:hypothetical protein
MGCLQKEDMVHKWKRVKGTASKTSKSRHVVDESFKKLSVKEALCNKGSWGGSLYGNSLECKGGCQKW